MNLEFKDYSRFSGYKTVAVEPALAELKQLRISLSNPPEVLTPRSLNRLWASWRHLNSDNPYLWDFAWHQDFYGKYCHTFGKIFLREESDMFTLIHELMHVAVQRINPGIHLALIEGFQDKSLQDRSLPERGFTYQSINEGVAQWAAIHAGLRSGNRDHVLRARRTHNLMATGQRSEYVLSTETTRFYEARQRFKQIIQEYCSNNLQEIPLRQDAYNRALNSLEVTIAGYAYVTQYIKNNDCITKPGPALTALIQNPPTQIEEILAA